MSDPLSKVCPLSFDGEKFTQTCMGDRCAWWAADLKLCAIEVAKSGRKPEVKPMPKEGAERRTSKRFSIQECTVRFRKGRVFGCYSKERCPIVNLSTGGLQFLNNDRLRPKQRVSMQVYLPGEKDPLKLKGRVIWEGVGNDTYLSRVGVEFTRSSEATWRRLRVLERASSGKAD